jgi:hypothetical protein
VAGRLAAAAHDRGQGAGSEITQAEELLQELGSFGLQRIDIVRHKGFLSVPQIVCTYIDVQNNVTKKELPQDGISMSPTRMTIVTRLWLRPAVASAGKRPPESPMGAATMNPIADLRKEVLRLTKLQNRSVCFRVPQLAAIYNLPERRVREEFANLAQKHLIELSSWDGHELRELSHWSNPEEFINSTADAGPVHAGAVSAQRA